MSNIYLFLTVDSLELSLHVEQLLTWVEVAMILKLSIPNSLYQRAPCALAIKLIAGECHSSSPTTIHSWFRQWFGAVIHSYIGYHGRNTPVNHLWITVYVLPDANIITTVSNHDDDIKWKHFPRYWPFVRRIHRSPVNSPHKGQWRGDLMFFYMHQNNRLSTQSRHRWLETPSRSLWRHCNEWRIYVSVDWVACGLGNDMVIVSRHNVTWTSYKLLPIGPSGSDFKEIRIKTNTMSLRNTHLLNVA